MDSENEIQLRNPYTGEKPSKHSMSGNFVKSKVARNRGRGMRLNQTSTMLNFTVLTVSSL
jgi:hypothetical protein